MSAMTSSVAGLMTPSVRPLSASIHLPSMNIFLSVAVAVAIEISFADGVHGNRVNLNQRAGIGNSQTGSVTEGTIGSEGLCGRAACGRMTVGGEERQSDLISSPYTPLHSHLPFVVRAALHDRPAHSRLGCCRCTHGHLERFPFAGHTVGQAFQPDRQAGKPDLLPTPVRTALESQSALSSA